MAAHPGHDADCALCRDDGGTVVHRAVNWRVVLVDEPLFPGFARVIWNTHVREMTDLAPAGRDEVFAAVMTVEAAMRKALVPDKINLASLGNEVAHVHWHIIPRWRHDSHFPRPIWAAPLRTRPGLADDPALTGGAAAPAAAAVPDAAALAAWPAALAAAFGAAANPTTNTHPTRQSDG